LAALGWRGEPATAVSAALLNAIPPGADIAAPAIASAGGPSTVAGHRVGEVFVVHTQGGARQYGVVLADGVAEMTQVQADLLLARPGSPVRPGLVELAPSEYAKAAHAASFVPAGDGAPPATTPVLAHPAGGVCASFVDASVPAVGVTGPATRGAHEIRTSGGVDWVAVAPGRGAIVEAVASASAPSGSLALVTDAGVRHALTPDVLPMLGYAAVRPLRLPAALVALLPAGPALDPAAAAR
jgi:hypothetical protein